MNLELGIGQQQKFKVSPMYHKETVVSDIWCYHRIAKSQNCRGHVKYVKALLLHHSLLTAQVAVQRDV